MGPEPSSERRWSDDELSAYLDAALPDETMADLDQALAADAGLQKRLDALVAVNAAVKVAFNAPLQEATPERFKALFESAAKPAGAVVAFQPKVKPARALDWRLPIAAGFALVIGGLGGAAITRTTAPPDQLLAIASALETTPSATQAESAAGAIKPVLSFAAADGRICREFELYQQTQDFLGVACRTPKGWEIEALLAASGDLDAKEGFAQASGHAAGAVDSVLDALGASDPISADREAELIRQGWRADP